MSFQVVPPDIDAFADFLTNYGGGATMSGACQEAQSYVASYSGVPHDEGDLFADIYLANRGVVERLDASYQQLSFVFGGCGISLRQAAGIYRQTDDAQSARMDGVLPGTAAPPMPESTGRRPDAGDTTSALSATPSKDAPIPDMVHWIMDKAGWFSIAGMAMKIASVLGLDPVKELTQSVLGDYDELAQAGHAAEALADFDRALAAALEQGLVTVRSTWSGHAADAAQAYFMELSGAITDHATELDELGAKYAELVQCCAQIAEVVGGALATAIDQVLICVAELAAAGCLASVPGINVIIAAIGAYQVFVTREAIALFLKYTGNIATVVESFVGLVLYVDQAFKDTDTTDRFPAIPFTNGVPG
ncbi:WXG100 family type VII secretion target [Nocardioides sp. Leaf307]|uniref:WXG100 family type VII secretion target n=1 Tax=Nocardioides sp. Leaf307 TaxID=1736331 RepID=UPI000702EEB9|nr:WXG100 family type VII secretion target [Nocardioides sp. Leaf307]KQQ39410.1 hypothetical protein ASF50_15830 [Nocardioides sp. Leaf307]